MATGNEHTDEPSSITALPQQDDDRDETSSATPNPPNAFAQGSNADSSLDKSLAQNAITFPDPEVIDLTAETEPTSPDHDHPSLAPVVTVPVRKRQLVDPDVLTLVDHIRSADKLNRTWIRSDLASEVGLEGWLDERSRLWPHRNNLALLNEKDWRTLCYPAGRSSNRMSITEERLREVNPFPAPYHQYLMADPALSSTEDVERDGQGWYTAVVLMVDSILNTFFCLLHFRTIIVSWLILHCPIQKPWNGMVNGGTQRSYAC